MKCSKCSKEVSEKIYNYSKKKYSKCLCMDCQGEKPKKRDTFDYDMIKGRIGEALIEQLFIKLKYKVYRYGMENTIPGIIELLGKAKTQVSNVIKRMPDFVIQDQSGKAYFIEVKFRSREMFSLSDLEEDKYGEYPFPNAFFIVVSKSHIKCLSYEQLKEGKKITPTYRGYYLGDVKAFETDKEVIKKFCKYATKFFEGV
jgi:hypothetical protein